MIRSTAGALQAQRAAWCGWGRRAAARTSPLIFAMERSLNPCVLWLAQPLPAPWLGTSGRLTNYLMGRLFHIAGVWSILFLDRLVRIRNSRFCLCGIERQCCGRLRDGRQVCCGSLRFL